MNECEIYYLYLLLTMLDMDRKYCKPSHPPTLPQSTNLMMWCARYVPIHCTFLSVCHLGMVGEAIQAIKLWQSSCFRHWLPLFRITFKRIVLLLLLLLHCSFCCCGVIVSRFAFPDYVIVILSSYERVWVSLISVSLTLQYSCPEHPQYEFSIGGQRVIHILLKVRLNISNSVSPEVVSKLNSIYNNKCPFSYWLDAPFYLHLEQVLVKGNNSSSNMHTES